MNPTAEYDLEATRAVQEYLRLNRVYSDYLGGLRWSSSEDSLVHGDGRLFAFNEAIAAFLDGFASQGRVIPFACVLHWMDLLLNQRQLRTAEIQRLRRIFLEGPGDWRHAAALAATLSEAVPEPIEPPDLARVARRLRDRAFPIRWFLSQFTEAGERAEPTMAPAAFEHMMIVKLSLLSEDDLRAWLKTGRGPIRDAERLAQELPAPRDLAGLLALLLERPRLAGAKTYVSQMVGALALPPRRFMPDELPVGGYSDIVTRGQVEHLLPAQFALDEIEFVRRFTENELLYFRREEPPAQSRQELVVLLDQGVRTWGDVRLVLTAGVLALLKQATRRHTPCFLAATSNEGDIVEPMEVEPGALGELFEASDFSLNPGLALESVLETPTEAQRDVVLLTNPRSLREADVLAAARRLRARDRLFALTLDRHGQAALSEVRRGTAMKLRQFHVEFAPSTPRPRAQPPRAGAPTPAWTGDVEAIPFPFRLGTETPITDFDFDYEGRRLLTVSGEGTLHVWNLDGSAHEMLPRPAVQHTLKTILGIIGVHDGFVMVGRSERNRLVVAHYGMSSRHCRAHELDQEVNSPLQHVPLYYDHAANKVLLLAGPWAEFSVILTVETFHVELEVDESTSVPPRFLRSNRAVPLTVGTDYPVFANFDPATGVLTVAQTKAGKVESFGPIMDGKPCLAGARAMAVQMAGTTIALQAKRRDLGESITLLRFPDGGVLREFPMARSKHKVTWPLLSFDGNRIALGRSDHRVEVHPVHAGNGPIFCTRVGGHSPNVQFHAGLHCLLFHLGGHRSMWHFFFWGNGKLTHERERNHLPGHDTPQYMRTSFAPVLQRVPPPFLMAMPQQLPKICDQDRSRFTAACKPRLWFVLDRFGQVAVLDRHEKLLAMFFAQRNRWAAWLPDGTRLGSLDLCVGPVTDGAEERIARVLLDAEMEGPA